MMNLIQNSEYQIALAHEIRLSNIATDWFIKSLKYPYMSEEWQICRLKEKMYRRQAQKHLDIVLDLINIWEKYGQS